MGAVELTYRVRFLESALAGGTGTVEARLFHQATTREYVEALAAANATDGTGDQLHAIWETTGRAAPVLMTSASVSAPLTQSSAVTGSCACQATSGGVALVPAVLLLLGIASRRRTASSDER